jgi:hypothetical protein
MNRFLRAKFLGQMSVTIILVLFISFVFIGSICCTTDAVAEPIVYPSKGQSKQQQSKDEGECHQWAKQQTGVDPQKLAEEATTGEVYQRHHSALGGAAKGALLGVVGGAIGGDAGKGAAIGAGVGAVAGTMRSRRDLDAQHQAYDSAHATQRAQLKQYDRGYSTCMRGRGYSVSE